MMINSPPQLWNQRADTRTIATKANEVKSRLVEDMGVQNINQINNRMKNLSPDQIRSNPVDHIVSAVKGAMSTNNHHVLLHGGGTNPNGPSAPDFSQQPQQMIPQMQSPMINYRNQGQANYHTANPTSHRHPDNTTAGNNSPLPLDRNQSGA